MFLLQFFQRELIFFVSFSSYGGSSISHPCPILIPKHKIDLSEDTFAYFFEFYHFPSSGKPKFRLCLELKKRKEN